MDSVKNLKHGKISYFISEAPHCGKYKIIQSTMQNVTLLELAKKTDMEKKMHAGKHLIEF